MSIKLMSQVWESADVSGSELLVLLALADFANDDGSSIYPAMQTIARKARLSTDQARRVVHKLIDAGMVELVEQGGWIGKRNRPNEYKIVMQSPCNLQAPCTDARTSDALEMPEIEGGTRADARGGTGVDASTVLAPVQDDPSLEPSIQNHQLEEKGEVAADAASPSWSEYLEAFCWICHGHKNLSVLTKEQKGALVSEAKRVHDGDFTIDDLRDWFRNFWQNDWRWTKKNGNGKPQHERPRPSDVRSMIPAIRNTEPEQAAPSYSLDVPGIVPLPVNGNGHSAPPLPRPMPTDDPWSIAVAELTPVLSATSAARWLQGSRLEPNGELAGVPFYRVVLTADGADAGWMMQQAEPAIRKKVASLLGKRIQLEIVTDHLEPAR